MVLNVSHYNYSVAGFLINRAIRFYMSMNTFIGKRVLQNFNEIPILNWKVTQIVLQKGTLMLIYERLYSVYMYY